jgi:hypothetical protein
MKDQDLFIKELIQLFPSLGIMMILKFVKVKIKNMRLLVEAEILIKVSMSLMEKGSEQVKR